VQILLGREEVNPDEPAIYGKMPLFYAAWLGRQGVVKMLLRGGEVNPDIPDNYGKRLFSCAAWHGHEEW